MNNLRNWVMAMILSPLGAIGAVVNGQVTGGGNPLSGAKVVLFSNQQATDSTVTDARGNYSFARVTVGAKMLQASMTGYRNGVGIANVQDPNDTVTVDIELIAIWGGATGIVRGTVRNARNQQAIANATVRIGRFGGVGGGAYADSTRTNAQGQYVFDSVPVQNNYAMSASAAGYLNGTQTGVNVESGQTDTVNFNLTPSPASLRPVSHGLSGGAIYRTGGQLILEVGVSARNRVAEIYAWNGALRHQALILAGESRLHLPADLADDLVLRLREEN